MGMDVRGLNPKSKAGEYFRASIWSWPPILDAMAATGLVDKETLNAMAHNDGAGLGDETAMKVADKIEEMMENDVIVMPSEAGQTTANFAKAFVNAMGADDVTMITPTTVGTDKEHMELFIQFCRKCGGFEVY